MKKIIVISAFLLLSALLFAQYSVEYDRIVNAMTGWTLAKDHRYADLKEGGYTTWWSRSFYEGLEYTIVAFSDDPDVLDVDIEVRDSYGNSYKVDESEDKWGVVRFRPSYDRALQIRMTNYSSLDPLYSSRCRYLIFYRK